jgi:hypothetical protein
MEIQATHTDDGYTLALSGASASSVIELRFQNTMNGITSVQTVDADGSGNAKLTAPFNFGQNFAITARVNDALIPFTIAPDSSHKTLRYIHPDTLHLVEPAVATTVTRPAHTL